MPACLTYPDVQVMYSNFLQMVDAGVVQTARIDDGMSHIYFRLQWPKQPAASLAASEGA